MRVINAATERHRSLYHYQSFKDESVGYLTQTLRERTIRMSKPSGFNDPWDSKPWFNSSILDDPDERERHLQWLIAAASVQPADADEMRANPELLRATVELVRDGNLRAIDENYRVYCLSPDPLIQLMWAHYGDNHRGVALEFDARAGQMLSAFRVDYSSDYPTVRVYDAEENAALVPIFTKSDVWAYENEYRLIAEESIHPLRDMLRTADSILRLEPGALIGLVIGCQCDADHVLDIVDRHASDLRVRRAVRVMDKYELRLETLR
ncbi:DUF2971 domain-containing protein [Burkholderia cepacia]|uniref:DUF2971 domain-containing protein n=1 Tax=Burkholderia cepacia TaxID=292 RepID=UPI001CF535AB|nr:DUF2971 domain-containing protein [Burkholderia cepacia]MCA7937581.1 DUF2971 domain-containing protein [Burkholderia cepacia]